MCRFQWGVRGARVPAWRGVRGRGRRRGRARRVPLPALLRRVRASLRLRRHLVRQPLHAAAGSLPTPQGRQSTLRRTMQYVTYDY